MHVATELQGVKLHPNFVMPVSAYAILYATQKGPIFSRVQFFWQFSHIDHQQNICSFCFRSSSMELRLPILLRTNLIE